MTRPRKPPPPEYQLHFSERGIPLVNCSGSRTRPVITVENYCKWYGLYLIHVDGRVESIDSEIMDEIYAKDPVAIRGDHNFHPRLLYRLEEHLKASLCSQSLQMVIGRFMLELDFGYDAAIDLNLFREGKKC
mgnify:CR=1 FL=1